jgi:protein involved in polysaccharide export with SLBB domain
MGPMKKGGILRVSGQNRTRMPRGKGNLGKRDEPGAGRKSIGRGVVVLLVCALIAGCRSNPYRANVEKNLLNDQLGTGHRREIVEKYMVACPDVLQIHVEERGEFDGLYTVGPNGCLALGSYGAARVEGQTLPGVAQAVAEVVGSQPERVHVRVANFASRHLSLVGEVVGRHRTIPYQGEETVLDVLQRVGGITPGAEPTEIYVVRSHIADWQRPEIFHVDLQAIVMNEDQQTNIRVRPYDQIYVGETRQARIEKCIPPWLRPTYQIVWNMLPTGKTPQEKQHSFTGWMRGWLPFGNDPVLEAPPTSERLSPLSKSQTPG